MFETAFGVSISSRLPCPPLLPPLKSPPPINWFWAPELCVLLDSDKILLKESAKAS